MAQLSRRAGGVALALRAQAQQASICERVRISSRARFMA
jgi:hypothetical protein